MPLVRLGNLCATTRAVSHLTQRRFPAAPCGLKPDQCGRPAICFSGESPSKTAAEVGNRVACSGAESALCAAVSMLRISRLQSSDPRVSMRALTHSHVPMAHGGYATT